MQENYFEFAVKTLPVIEAETGCQRPCQYYTYTLAGEEEFPLWTKDIGLSHVYISYSQNPIKIKEEVYLYPLEAVVAYIGGILSLFFGLSFLSIWDELILQITKLVHKLKKSLK